MDKKRREIIITSFLILIFVLAWARAFKVLEKRAVSKAKAPLVVSPVTAPATQPTGPFKKTATPSPEEKLAWVRDPFSGRAYTSITEEGVQDLRLEGIIWDEKKPVAMINSRIVKVGDNIGLNRVVEIKPDKVVLNDGSRNFELKVR